MLVGVPTRFPARCSAGVVNQRSIGDLVHNGGGGGIEVHNYQNGARPSAGNSWDRARHGVGASTEKKVIVQTFDGEARTSTGTFTRATPRPKKVCAHHRKVLQAERCILEVARPGLLPHGFRCQHPGPQQFVEEEASKYPDLSLSISAGGDDFQPSLTCHGTQPDAVPVRRVVAPMGAADITALLGSHGLQQDLEAPAVATSRACSQRDPDLTCLPYNTMLLCALTDDRQSGMLPSPLTWKVYREDILVLQKEQDGPLRSQFYYQHPGAGSYTVALDYTCQGQAAHKPFFQCTACINVSLATTVEVEAPDL
eukprot:gene8460-1512_t